MARHTPSETLEHFIRRQDTATLADVLLELAADHSAVQERLVRLQRSSDASALAAVFRKTLTGWQRSIKYFGYSESGEFGRALEAWLGQVERELMQRDPAAALALAEAFIESDKVFFESADDSYGSIGDAVRAGCCLWLKAASHCESPATEWPGRIEALVAADEYGAREALLRRANLLLDEAALRALAAKYEAQVDTSLARPGASSDRADRPTSNGLSGMSLLSEALRDPDLLARAVLKRSPSPDPVQRQQIARAYVEYDRAEGALSWLDGPWPQLEASRQRLRAEVFTRIGRTGEAAVILQHIFEDTLALSDFHAWLDLLPARDHAQAIEHAKALAKSHDDPVVVARLLLDTGDDAGAEAALIAAPGRVPGGAYGTLVPLAEELENRGRWTGATVVYRALLVAILDRGYARAYRHGAKYWVRLQMLAGKCSGFTPLESPETFETAIRVQHKRKASFWAEVAGARREDPDETEDGQT